MLADRALVLADVGLNHNHHLAQALTALSLLSDSGWNEASGLASDSDGRSLQAITITWRKSCIPRTRFA
jgi:hypothetical protein